MKWPPVSVVVITKNEEKSIGKCLGFLKSMDYPSFEIILADSSADRTPQIARKLGVMVVNVPKKGYPAARNAGVRKARHGLVAFTDADCIVPKDWLRVMVRSLGDASGAGGNSYPTEDTNYLGKCVSCLGTPAGGALGYDAAFNRRGKGIDRVVTCNAIFRKSALVDVGLFDEKLVSGGEDTDISDRLTASGHTLVYARDSYVLQRPRESMKDFWCWNKLRGRSLRDRKGRVSKKELMFSVLVPVLLPLSWPIMVMGMRKRFRFLVRRRKRIKIDSISIFIVVPLLFYIRTLARAIGQLT